MPSDSEPVVDPSAEEGFRGPLIVAGMHRSGTSMLSRLAGRLGVFQGHDVRGSNNEAGLFYSINEWLLREAGAAWDRPEPVRELTQDPALVSLAANHIRKLLGSMQLVNYLGPLRLARYRKLENMPIAWGFKDPRSVYTLPVWLKLFPQARVLFINRNGVDVAASLSRRTRDRVRRAEAEKDRELSWRARTRPRPYIDHHLALSLRCKTLQGGFDLWSEYCDEGLRHLKQLPENRRLVLKYEDLVRDPAPYIPSICRLAGIDYRPEMLKLASDLVDPDKVERFRQDPVLTAFYERVRDDRCMTRLGYGGPRKLREVVGAK